MSADGIVWDKAPADAAPSSGSPSEASGIVWDQDKPAAPVTPQLTRPGVTDHLKQLGGSVLQAAGSTISGLGRMADAASDSPAQPNLLRPALVALNPHLPARMQMSPQTIDQPEAALAGAIGNPITNLGNKIQGSESDAFKAEAAKPLVEGSLYEGSLTQPSTLRRGTLHLGAGATSPTAIAANVENLAGQAAPLVAGGLELKGAEAAEAAGARVLPAVLDSAPAWLKRAASSMTPQTAKTMAVGASQFGEQAGAQEQQRIEAMTPEQLAQVPAYQQMVARGMSPADAQKTLAAQVHEQVFNKVAPLGAVAGVTSALPLLEGSQGALASAVGTSRLKRAALGAALEAPTQAGVGAGMQAVQVNAANQATGENRDPMADSGSTAVTGALMGAGFGVAGGLHGHTAAPTGEAAADAAGVPALPTLTRPAPGSLTDVAQSIGGLRPNDAGAQKAGAPPLPADTQPQPAAAKAPLLAPGTPPWMDPATGEVTTPDRAQLTAALADHMVQQYQQAGHLRIDPQQITKAWGVPQSDVARARKQAVSMANDQIAENERAAMAQGQDQSTAPAAGTADQGTTASIPFMITQGMKDELRSLGHSDAAISAMTPEQAHATLQAGERVLGPARDLLGHDQPATDEAMQQADEAAATTQEPSSAQEPDHVSSQPEAKGDSLDRASGSAGSESPSGSEAGGTSEASAEEAAAPREGVPAASTAESTPAVAREPDSKTDESSLAQSAAPDHSTTTEGNGHAAEVPGDKAGVPETPPADAASGAVRSEDLQQRAEAGAKAGDEPAGAAGSEPPGPKPEASGAAPGADLSEPAAKTPPKGGVSVSESKPAAPFKVSAAARDAEGMRVKTADGEVNGRTLVDNLMKAGYTKVESGRFGDKLNHFMVKPDGTKEPIKARLLRYAQEATARAADAGLAHPVDFAAHEAATSPHNDLQEPTKPQIEAGNYKKGHIDVHGMDISIENPRGSTRSGVGENGKPWSHEMSDHYGYVRGTVGADGDHVDAYVGAHPESKRVFVVDQINQKTGAFDEHKAMIGFRTKGDAVRAYKSNFDKGWKVGPVKDMTVDQFKDWLKNGDTSKPIAQAPEASKEPLTAGQRRTEELLGAGVGDTVRTTGFGDAIQPGSIWKIERIDKDGTLHTTSPGGGYGDFKRSELEREVRKGATFEKVSSKASGKELTSPRSAKDVAAKPGQSNNREIPPGPELPAAPYDMTAEQLQAHADAVAAYGRKIEDAVLGDQADAWRRDTRAQNSSNHETAARASSAVDAIEANLSEEQKNALYGVGGKDEHFDDLQDFRDVQSHAQVSSPAEAAEEMARLLPTLGNTEGRDPAKWKRDQQVAYAGMRTLRDRIQSEGWNSAEIQKRALQLAASKYSDMNDAGFMLKRFLTPAEKNAQAVDGKLAALAAPMEAAPAKALFDKEASAEITSTPEFKRFFGDSKVTDAKGEPLPVYHGTADDFTAFDPNRSGSATAHMTARLGTFFAEDRGKAEHYARNASNGVPAEERVVDAYLSIQKPYEMSLKEFMGIDSPEESTALREKLQAEGYDGIHIKEADQWVAFDPHQIKSASENRGTFDRNSTNIYHDRAPMQAAASSGASAADIARVRGQVNEITKAWKGDDKPTVRVLATPEDLPDFAKRNDDGSSTGYQTTRGMYDGRNIYVFASKHPDTAAGREQLKRTLVHESVGHYGIDRIVTRELGADAWSKIEGSIARLETKKLGGEKMRSVLADVRKRYGADIDAATFARETLAVMAERGVRNGLLDRAIAAVRAFVRRIMPSFKLSERELRQLLVKSDEYLQRGESYAQRVQSTQAMAFSRDGWNKDFPDAVYAMPHGELAKHPDYAAAKAGDGAAALRLARDVVTPEFVDKVRSALPEGSEPVIVPVVAREAAGDNEIPRMAAEVLAQRLGLKADTEITQADKVSRGGSDAMHRIANQPAFEGKVERGKDYVLLDDMLAQGGTLAQLKTHIEREGGKVVLATALTGKEYSRKLALDQKSLEKVRGRYGSIEGWWKQQFGHGFDGLTESEARAILTYDKGRLSPDGLRNRILAGKIPEIERVGEAAARDRPGAEASGSAGRLSDTSKPPRADFDKTVPEDTNDRGDPDKPGRPRAPFSKASASIEAMREAMPKIDDSAFQKAWDWVKGKLLDAEPHLLGALQLRHVLELAKEEKVLEKPATTYADLFQKMDADRNSMTMDGAAKAERLNKFAFEHGPAGWFGKLTDEAKGLFKFMHEVTQIAVDPTTDYQRLLMRDSRGEQMPWTKDLVKERIQALRGQMRGRAGDDKTQMMDEIKDLRKLPAREKARELKYPELVAKWNKLSPEAQNMFGMMRDHYRETSEKLEAATLQRIQALEIPEQSKRAASLLVSNNFSDAKVGGVYFPLARFGDYFIGSRSPEIGTGENATGGDYSFTKYGSANEAIRAEKQLKAAGHTIELTGKQNKDYDTQKPVTGTFMGQLTSMLRAGHAPDKVIDDIHQMFLRTLPELSLRKSGIHRNNVAGYTDNVPRVFASNVLHGAHQIAKARYGYQLQDTLEHMKERLEAQRTNMSVGHASHADALMGELAKRNEWIMNPSNSKLATMLNAIGFGYYLSASPASALVNMTQGPMITLPVLGARHGWPAAMKELGSATRDAMRTGGNIRRTLTNDAERAAFDTLERNGTFARTATHSLGGIAEGDALKMNPAYTKVMTAMGYLFQKAEVINRESAGIAAFRLATKDGKSFNDAVKYADEIVNGTHFDYSNANRARYMQGNVQKVLFQFKNYALGMSWVMYRNLDQSLRGETPEIRRIARRTLTGILGMTSLFAGVMGTPINNLLSAGANAYHAATGNSDEPWDFNTEFRAWLDEHLGETMGSVIADGAVNQLGANVSSRLGTGDLWFRDADKELQGGAAYDQALESLAGPIGAMTKNMFVGSQMINEGHTERGIETIMPTFIKNAMKSVRFASEGVNNLRGDPIVPDVSGPQQLIQALGFQPTKIAEQQRTNNALMNYSKFITDRRQNLMNAYAMAQQQGDADGLTQTLRRIASFNQANPEVKISMITLRDSLRQRAKISQQADNGIVLNKKLAARVKQEVGVQPGE
jgi:hypothetical protein